jgi:peptidoglycan/xylan/chitin deacetylase (PgdA/CDA1 family)
MRKFLEPSVRGMIGVLDAFGVLEFAQPWLSGMGLILMFHRVTSPAIPIFDPSLVINPDSLDWILGYIRFRGWEIVSVDQVHDRLANGPHRRPFVCFTFDDGYADNLTIALPIFRRHQAPMCVNITVGYINRTTPSWWVALGELLLQRDEIEFSGSGKIERIALGTWKQKVSAYQRLGPMLYDDVVQGRSPLGRTWAINGVDPQGLSDRFFMTWKELHEFAQDPLVRIGAHTITHRSLGHLKENEAGDEIEQSRKILNEKIGVPIDTFAYPFGAVDDCGPREFSLVRELGFKTAVTTRWCNIFPEHREHLVSLPRKSLSCQEISKSVVRARLYGGDLSLKLGKRIVLD